MISCFGVMNPLVTSQVTGGSELISAGGTNVVLGLVVVQFMFVEIMFVWRLVTALTDITPVHSGWDAGGYRTLEIK